MQQTNTFSKKKKTKSINKKNENRKTLSSRLRLKYPTTKYLFCDKKSDYNKYFLFLVYQDFKDNLQHEIHLFTKRN